MPKKSVAKTAPRTRGKAKAADPSMEQAMKEMLNQFSLMIGGEEITVEDVKAFSASLGGPSPHDHLGDLEAEAKEDAQIIAFEAMEAGTEAQARRLAKRALKLDPDCVDALVVLVNLDAHTQIARIEGLQAAVAAAERSMGAKFVLENSGDFWLLIETRPYMRALEQLAGEMASAGMNLEAIAIYEKMLKLNPGDNQGVRDPLLGLYLAVKDLKGAEKLLKRYKNDASACFSWGRVIERFLASDNEGAAAALRKAVDANRFVALHLTGQETVSTSLPEMYSPGSVEEAVICQLHLGIAWAAHKDALFWFFDQCAAMGMTLAVSRENLKSMKVADRRSQ